MGVLASPKCQPSIACAQQADPPKVGDCRAEAKQHHLSEWLYTTFIGGPFQPRSITFSLQAHSRLDFGMMETLDGIMLKLQTIPSLQSTGKATQPSLGLSLKGLHKDSQTPPPT